MVRRLAHAGVLGGARSAGLAVLLALSIAAVGVAAAPAPPGKPGHAPGSPGSSGASAAAAPVGDSGSAGPASPPTSPPAAQSQSSSPAPSASSTHQPADPTAQEKALSDIQDELLAVYTLYEQASRAASRTKDAQSIEDATRAADLASGAADDARRIADQVEKKYGTSVVGSVMAEVRGVSQGADDVEAMAASAKLELQRKESASTALCGANSTLHARPLCVYYGIYTATLSQVRVKGEPGSTVEPFWGGQSRHRLASVAVPTVGVRLRLPYPVVWYLTKWKQLKFASLDLGVYSAFISPTVSEGGAAVKGSAEPSCSKSNGEFETRLPCQGNASVSPYAAGYFGVTFGKSGIGYVSLMPITVGVGQVGTEGSLRTFSGWTVGLIELHGTL